MQRALLLSLVAASYLLLAGGPRWTLAVLGAIAALGVLAAPQRTLTFPTATRSFDLALIAIAAGIGLQLVPLPAPLVHLLSPSTARLAAATQFTVGEPAWWLPLSIDARSTFYALGAVVLGIVTFWIARATFSAGGQSRSFFRLLGLLGALAAMVAVVQKAVAPGLLLGVVVPDARNANPMGPFLNRNHFAGWLLLVVAATVGYLIAHLRIHPAYRQGPRAAMRRFFASGGLLSAIGVFIMIGAILMTLSRSAVVGLGAGALFGGWIGKPRMRFERTRMPALLIGLGLAMLLLSVFVDTDAWLTRVQQSRGLVGEGFDRVTIWRESLPIIRDFYLAGTGAGSFGEAMGQYQQTRIWLGSMQQWAHFNTAHSHFVQLAVEGGLLLALPVLAAMIVLARLGLTAIRTDKGEVFWMRVGAAAGLVGIAVQSIWEVPLIMPANAVLAAVLAGFLLHRRDLTDTTAEVPWVPGVRSRRTG